MIFNLSNHYEIPKFKEYVNKLFSERAVVEVKKKLPNRTLAQNSYLHLLLGYFGSEYGCSLDEAKIDFYKRTCNRDLFERKMVNKKGNEVTYLRSSAELTTGEMTLSIDRFRNWSASVAGIYLPAANEQQMLIYAQQEIERNKELIYNNEIMKNISEMTEQEIIALSDEDVQKMIKLRMMEEGIKLLDKPKVPELFEIEPADTQYFSIPLLDGFAFTDIEEATKVAEILKSAKSLRKVDYDWNRLGSEYKYLKKSERYKFNGNSDFDILSGWAYSNELYAKISNFAAQNKVMKEQAEKDKKEYEKQLSESAELVQEITERVREVRNKYDRLETLSCKFATDYYPLSDNNEDMAMKFMVKAYSLNDEEQSFVRSNYKKHLLNNVQ